MNMPNVWVVRLLCALAVVLLGACSSGGGDGGNEGDATEAVTVGGVVSGLQGAGLVLRNNAADDLAISADGPFTFAVAITNGSSYEITIGTQPSFPAQDCVITNGSGTGTTDITDVSVACTSFATITLQADAGAGQVVLSWNDNGATSYNLYSASVPECDINTYGACPDGNLVIDLTSPHTMSGLTDGKTYYFRIESLHPGGARGLSNEANAVPRVVNLPQTGQTRCYDEVGTEIDCAGTGQDGELQAGLGWPDPRFTDNADGTVTDNLTGLMWLKDANCMRTHYSAFDVDDPAGDGDVDWLLAFDFIKGINDGTYSDCSAGQADWRLPTVTELVSLHDLSQSGPALPAGHPFVNVGFAGRLNYWSSTSGTANTLRNMGMRLGAPGSSAKGSNTWFVWPVRGTSNGPARVWKTGQTECFDEVGDEIDCTGTGQDGETQTGVAWPEPRFVDNGDGTITDGLTGLTWLKDANCVAARYPAFDSDGTLGDGAVTWQHALDFVQGVNAGTFGDCAAGHDDWRFPNLNEMISLSSVNELFNTNWLNSIGFENVQSGIHWSSTTSPSSATRAMIMIGQNATWGHGLKSDSWHFLLVRGD